MMCHLTNLILSVSSFVMGEFKVRRTYCKLHIIMSSMTSHELFLLGNLRYISPHMATQILLKSFKSVSFKSKLMA